jgi:AraC family L-rhamnose operon transcriptional activator RhaR
LPFSHLSEGLHRHEFAELALIIKGQALHQTPFGEYPIRAGDIYFIPQGMVHGVRRIEGLALVNLLFVPERFLFPFTRLSCIPGFHTLFTLRPQADGQGEFVNKLRLDPLELVRVEGVLARIRQELDERRDGYALAAENLAAGLLIDLCRLMSVEGEASGIFHFRIARAISKLEQHLSEPIDLERAAGFAGMGARSFQRYFAQAMGCSFSNYLLGMRLRRAAVLLRTSHVGITEIGLECGFPDNNYFTRAFRKGMGITPTEYRRRS